MDIESYIVQWLKGQKFRASTRVSNPRPAGDFLTVERFGGGLDNIVIERPRISIRCWSDSAANAAVLANRVKGLIPEIVRGGHVRKVEITAVANDPDETVDPPHQRYEILLSMTYIP